MSIVTTVLLCFSLLEDGYEHPDGAMDYGLMHQVNAWLMERHYGRFGAAVGEIAGGNKALEVAVYAAAFNHFDVNTFVDMLKTLEWEEPSAVQVFVKGETDTLFRVIQPCV